MKYTHWLCRNDFWQRGNVNLDCYFDHIYHEVLEDQKFLALSVGHLLNKNYRMQENNILFILGVCWDHRKCSLNMRFHQLREHQEVWEKNSLPTTPLLLLPHFFLDQHKCPFQGHVCYPGLVSFGSLGCVGGPVGTVKLVLYSFWFILSNEWASRYWLVLHLPPVSCIQWNLDSSFLSGVWKINNGYRKTINAGAYIKLIKTIRFAYMYLLNQKIGSGTTVP
jgi:hypothetical protein